MDARIRDAIQAIEEATARVEAQQKAMGDADLGRALGFLHSARTAALHAGHQALKGQRP